MSIEDYCKSMERLSARAIAEGPLTNKLAAAFHRDHADKLERSRVSDPKNLEFLFEEPPKRRR
jgi:hypothetical protein